MERQLAQGWKQEVRVSQGVKSAKSGNLRKGEKVKLSRDVVPGGHGGTSEQVDAASGPVPKHPGPPTSIILPPFYLIWFGPARSYSSQKGVLCWEGNQWQWLGRCNW